MKSIETTTTTTKTLSKNNTRYIFPIALLFLVVVFQLLSEGASLQNPPSSEDKKAPDQLLKLQQAEEEVSKLQGQLEESKEQLEKLQHVEQDVSKLQSELAESKEQLEKLKTAKEDVVKLQSQLESSQEQLVKLQNDNSTKTTQAFDPANICSILSPSSSATRLWKENLSAIYEASIAPKWFHFKSRGELDKIHWIIEEILTPSRMRRSIQHLPTFSHHIVKDVMQKLQKRIADPKNNPPLQIAVFGGSVTYGRDCAVIGRMRHNDCAWPYRFEHFVNHMFGQKLIEVHNLSIGGTHSDTATNRVKYWLYNAKLKAKGPDVIINSYSTNDSLPPWGKTWPEDDIISMVQETVRTRLQAFIREALQSKACEIPPLVVHVDDYLGPQQPALLGELGYLREMTQLAKYYDTVGISYPQVVRDIAYQDHSETDFHVATDVHYGRFAHMTIALSVAFASLELLINYCDDEYNIVNDNNTTGLVTNKEETNNALPHPLTKEEMKRGKYFLPPPLTTELLQANATIEYEAALDASYNAYVENDCETYDSNSDATIKDRNPCTIAWISTEGLFSHTEIGKFMKQYQTQNDGWQVERANAEGWSNKDGWIATKANSTFSLEFVADKKVKTASIYFLRSYGEKWKDSKAKFALSRVLPDNAKVVAEHEIDGVWADENYHYSLILSETIRLDEEVEIGEKITLQGDLVSGSHFKVMGMTLCNK